MSRILLLVLFAMLIAACGQQDARSQIPYVLTCADCEEEGMPANIWADASGQSRRVCTLEWGERVTVTDADGHFVRIKAAACEGWISRELIRASR